MVKKNGFHKAIQRYKCYACKRTFIGGFRITDNQLWYEYHKGKQTYLQLSIRYKCSIKTIQRRLDKAEIVLPVLDTNSVVVLMDTTYFGRGFGVMLFKDAITGRNLHKIYVKTETNGLYLQGIKFLQKAGFIVVGIVCDGRKGLLNLFPNIPVQMCQFHQVAIVRRYLTKKPKMQASKELWEITLLLKRTDKASFIGALELWYTKWESFYNEQKLDEKGKKRYVHKRLRSAFKSLKNNIKVLFLWCDDIGLKIPNTTNKIDGHFSDLKNKLRCHNGLSVERKMKFINEFFQV